ncbi:hypothetical protein LTR08_006292 [Meristemomyces frigidus]|nr:hypothetical protein LTR08_006292 [Meristemomyces frigidus]
MENSQRLSCVFAVAGGIASHVLYFNRFECHMYGILYLNTLFLSCAGSLVLLTKLYETSLVDAIGTILTFAGCYLLGAYSSLLIYRIFVNPLNRFPGPWPARLSSLYMPTKLGNSDLYYKLQALHQKYGRIVRIGANDLSIIDPDVMETSFGVHSKVTKGDFYDMEAPFTSLQTTRSKTEHDKRRKVWAPAFSDKALRDYEVKVEVFNDKIVRRFAEFQGGPVNVTKWFNLYSFDVMGRLAFGKDYGMLDSGEKHHALELLSESMQALALMLPAWIFRILVAIPGLAAGIHKFSKFCLDELTWRVENARELDEKGTDITSSLLKVYEGIDRPQQDPLLLADTKLIIVAGSDTTAATFTYLFYHLAQDPSQVKRLRDELRPLTQGEWSDKEIRQAQHLNGAINEALRMHPPVPSGVARLTPKEGMRVGNTYVPGNATFIVPQYVMGRDESSYQNANAFVPERWYSKPEMIKHKEAYAPFSTGPYGCIGKNLALIELRTLTARLILEFDVKLAPGEDGHRLLYETLDHFTVDLGGLDLVFTQAAIE